MDQPRGNVLDSIEPTFVPERFDAALHAALRDKAAEHPVSGFTTMTVLGG